MYNYDFKVLQPNEFECLTRDLIQEEYSISLESFTSGRDDGIDMRYATSVSRNYLVVQAKRYTEYSALISNLRQEVLKVRKINPKRYILSTSVGLTPANKDCILDLFKPFILSTSDIIGKDDLNNLLGRHPSIEKQYYKLWLSSTAVLDRIVNSRVENWSSFEKSSIEREVSTYVMNSSFDEAMSILLKNRYVIISGIPGIGKTSLAKMLIYRLLGERYEELIRISTMDDAAQKFCEGKKQLFFFDDFLGAGYLSVNEDGFSNKIISFINKVKSQSDKLFILSTREYILSAAMSKYESFSIKNIEIAKCTVELAKYTEDIRARILYNHIASANIPNEYIYHLLESKQYLGIIKHKNFNPRIIEAFLNQKLYYKVSPKDFVKRFIEFFNNPVSVWEFAFNNLSDLAKYSLFVRMSMGINAVFEDDWYLAVKSFVKGSDHDWRLCMSELQWHDVIKILEGTFILTIISKAGNVVEFHNPSVYDFLINKLRQLPEIQKVLIETSAFGDQVFNTFTTIEYNRFDSNVKIYLDENMHCVLANVFRKTISEFKFCELLRFNNIYRCKEYNKAIYIVRMHSSFPVLFKNNISLIYDVITQDLMEDNNIPIQDRMNLFVLLDEFTQKKLDLNKLSLVLYKQSETSFDFVDIMPCLIKSEQGKIILESTEMLNSIELALETELDLATNEDECDMITENMMTLADTVIDLDSDIWNSVIENVRNRFPTDLSEDIEEDYAREYFYASRTDGDRLYVEMFSSLLSN